jgi:hypothetical protein
VNAALVAHASGFSWDEALLVLAPLVVVGALLGVARARVRRHAGHEAGHEEARSAAHDVGSE